MSALGWFFLAWLIAAALALWLNNGIRVVDGAAEVLEDDQVSPALAKSFDDYNARLEGPPAKPDLGEDRWERLIDPDSPDYNALAEWANNIAPELRKVTP
ncbi:hypothetical protein [Actinopolymorpha alba]|uniref:hypothetical protein n=1 Tax=Actinopolymorpha alba TaxID=533267 RepID=UPI00036A2E8A|nr:hypothetical protein [Actinopolymorpha alba]